ncbi:MULTISPECIES: ABC transporter permease [Brucella]|jgi:ABC-2 type transport system permease protein|uniref:ABC transporter permease n=1 Tax=Brucella lupini TaxID=255457 RepID=A0A256GIK2_9HYPH|nr:MULTISPECIES: ABC transporter permease [Brucella/Ochrobactrum group]MCR5941289.1 ABC transporter permease [Ochrobactrum sp. XJ1]QOD66718.1 ABC transporter permease [Ochrobactrum sp. MT180101]RNL47629.1 ABC transporter permease [Ochrobactrum sp. MH181795]KAB2704990.1 ABC transporter permease [Brucella lupini]KAB2724976.1 ABC transporter permease [Brucella anthropi]
MSGWFSFERLGAMLVKEFIQMRRDRITFAMMLVVPLMQLLLFGFAINNDPKSLPSALVATSQDHYTRAMISALETTGYYRFDHVVQSAAEAEALIADGTVSFVVTIPSDFARRVDAGEQPQILIEADATDPSVASGAISTLGTVAGQALLREQGKQAEAADAARSQLQVIVHRRYNPEGVSQYNIVPGLLGVILQMTMVMMTAMALTRETERGTMENLLAMPATPAEIMLGKVLPFLVVGGVQVVVVLVAAKLLFGVPFVGSLALLLTCVLIFVLSLVLLGYTISTASRTQMQAMQLTFFFFLPSLMLSGFMFPFRGMPDWAQALGEIFPLTHFLRIVRAVMLKGAHLSDIAGEVNALIFFVFLFASLALLRFRRTLD